MEKLLKVCLVLLVSNCVAGQIVNKSKIYDSNKTSITINCHSEKPQFDKNIVKELTFNCTVPNITYAEVLSELGISTLNTLRLNIVPSEFSNELNSTLFKKINVTKLILDYKFINHSGKINFIKMKSDVLYVLNDVRELDIHGVAVVNDKVIEKDNVDLDQCARLETLKISTCNLRDVPYGWLKNCKQLVNLRVSENKQRNATKEIRRNLLAGAVSLKKLEIVNCYIEELEDEVAHLVNLEVLNVSHNQIHYALTGVTLPNLVELDLSYNHIFSSGLLSLGVEKQPKLRILSIDFNTVLNICDNLGYQTTLEDAVPFNQNPLNLHLLQKFSLRGTITTNMCFANLNMSSLEYFDLSDSKISSIDFRALPKSRSRYLEVNLSGCPIRHISGFSFNETDYKQLHHEQLKISGLNVMLECECDEYFWMAKASREGRLKLSGALCENGRQLWAIPEEKWKCRKYTCGDCNCKTYWKDNSIDMECKSGDLVALPKAAGLRRLYASSNLVENVTVDDISKSLIYLDLRMNHIARMSKAASIELFANPDRHVRFYGNPIICDCENEPFIRELMDHFDRVEDYTSLLCIEDGRYIRDVDPDELCFSSSRLFHTVLVSSLGALVGFVALIIGLYYRFGKAAKVYLYSKGLCLFCIREDEVDADREYDAFVSFSHNDKDFVINNLLPNLESEPYNYKLCVHYRNWIAGELIPVQINQSIANSKRTIIVLSKSFLDSIWGLLEFRAAHLSSLKEGRTRLIIVIIDDILETGNLDGELRTYLRTNTYVKWGDPWFWDKVRYALPHRDVSNEMKIDSEDNENRFRIEQGGISNDVVLEEEIDVRTTQNEREDKDLGNENTKSNRYLESEDLATIQTSEDDDTKDEIKGFNQLAPGYQHRQISTDSAIEMENYK